jgi:hypothetical protein
MKNKFISICSALLLLSGTGGAFAQNNGALETLYATVASSCVETTYTFTTILSGMKVQGDHVLEIQGDCWHLEGNGLEIWCDGQSVWTMDVPAKELVIEDADQNGAGALANPAVLLVRMHEWLDVSAKKTSPDGSSVLYVMTPKPDKESGIESLDLELRKADGTLRRGSFVLEDGNKVSLLFSSMKAKEKRPVSYYRPSQTFDMSWIVTDLR